NSCKFRQECGFFTMRTGMKGTYNKDVIIVNQNLLVEHLFRTSEGYTPLIDLNHEAIIIDEAHNLEEKARNRLTEEWDKKRIQNLIKELRVLVSRRADFDKDLRERLEKTEIELLKMYDDLYVFVTNKAKDDEMHQMTRTNIEFDKYHPDRLLVLLNDFHLNVQLDMGGEGQRQESIMNELNGLITFIQNITNKKDSPLLFWGEIYKHKKGKLIKFCYAPKDIAQQLKNILFNNKTPIVLTSATITQPGENESEQYEYVTNSIGFSGRTTEVKHSPFPYSKNARLFIPENLPAPNSEDKDEYLNQITNSISQLITITEGRTLVLFTAKVDMEYVYHALKEKELDIKIWRQMEGSSQDEVINNFRKSKGVLLSTGTLWEGIDIPGSDLSSVIITKLPFPVPDPIIQYKVDQSNDRLKDVLIPEMIRDLRQGVGRLIRNENDKGLVSILDSRLSETSNKTYKTEVLNMLPITNQLRDIEEVKNFAEKDLKPLYKECM